MNQYNVGSTEQITPVDENSILNEIYYSTLHPNSKFGGAESKKARQASSAIDALLMGKGITGESLETTQELIIILEGIKHEEGFVSGFKYAMQLCAECQAKER